MVFLLQLGGDRSRVLKERRLLPLPRAGSESVHRLLLLLALQGRGRLAAVPAPILVVLGFVVVPVAAKELAPLLLVFSALELKLFTPSFRVLQRRALGCVRFNSIHGGSVASIDTGANIWGAGGGRPFFFSRSSERRATQNEEPRKARHSCSKKTRG